MSYRTYEIFKSIAYVNAVTGGLYGYYRSKYYRSKYIDDKIINIIYGTTIGYFFPITIPLLYTNLLKFPSSSQREHACFLRKL